MGLDITVYTKLKKITKKKRIEDGDWDVHVTRSAHPEIERSLDVEVGYYEYDEGSEYFGFRAGPYSGYNQFRELLCEAILDVKPKMVWERSENYVDKPFYEIINFSDCEGTMGPTVSKKLHNDFVTYREKFESFIKNKFPFYDTHYMKVYDNFTTGFEMASKGGVLVFC